VSRDRRRPRHERGKVVELFPGQPATGVRLIRFTESQLSLLADALGDAVWARRGHLDRDGQNAIQAAAYEALARYCGLDLYDDDEDPS
jgi:hypothetical protein